MQTIESVKSLKSIEIAKLKNGDKFSIKVNYDNTYDKWSSDILGNGTPRKYRFSDLEFIALKALKEYVNNKNNKDNKDIIQNNKFITLSSGKILSFCLILNYNY
jgi:hypothetical protein